MEMITILMKRMRMNQQQREVARVVVMAAVTTAVKEDSWKQFAIPFGRICVVM
jgi:lysophospholipid acyltransferase (LPLAT)-like uncharacterized protein